MPAAKTTEYTPSGVAAKLAFIQGDIDRVLKTGNNSHMKFKYFEEHKIIELLRPYQRDLKLAIVVDYIDPQHQGSLTSMTAVVTLIDTEQPADSLDRELRATYPIQATDTQGWGAAKAQTYGKKYALQKFFGIPMDDIKDGDNEAAVQQTTTGPAMAAPKKAAPAQVKLLKGALQAIHTSLPEEKRPVFLQRVSGELQTSYGVEKVEQLAAEAVAPFQAWISAQAA